MSVGRALMLSRDYLFFIPFSLCPYRSVTFVLQTFDMFSFELVCFQSALVSIVSTIQLTVANIA